jgi:thiamine kinase-like enzyme
MPELPVRASPASLEFESWRKPSLRRGRSRTRRCSTAPVRRCPARPPRISLLHGDCSLSNYIYTGVKIAAVVDWELATLGDPQQDVGYYLRFALQGSNREPGVQAGGARRVFEGVSGGVWPPARAGALLGGGRRVSGWHGCCQSLWSPRSSLARNASTSFRTISPRSSSHSPRTNSGSWIRSALCLLSIQGGCCHSREPLGA